MQITKSTILTLLMAVFAVVYLVQIFTVEPSQADLQQYKLSEGQLRALGLLVAVPYLLIWAVALVGYRRLEAYTQKIKHSSDGDAFSNIANGVFGLSLWLPVTVVVSSLLTSLYRSQPQLTPLMVRLDTYINLIILFVSFVFIFIGVRKLRSLVKNPHYSQLQRAAIISAIGLIALYVYMTFNDSARAVPLSAERPATYYLSDPMILFTVIIPRIIMWIIGIWSVINIYMYARDVTGTLYKRALSSLAAGLGIVIATLITLRYLQTLSEQLSGSSLSIILAILSALLLALGVGYLLIARGAKKLKTIEEV